MTLRAVFLTVSVLFSAAAQAQPAGMEVHKASNAYMNCLVMATRKHDDGRSNPADMGRKIQSACLGQERAWIDAQTTKLSAAERREFSERMRPETAAIATRAVLTSRQLGF